MKFTRNFPPKIKVASIFYPVIIPTDIVVDGNKSTNVFDASFLSLLMELLHFKVEIFEPADKAYGSASPDGNWTGLIGLVQREEADLAFSRISVTEERSHAVDFAYPYVYDTITFITDKPEYSRSRYAVFHPFSSSMWEAVFFSIIVVLLTCLACKINGHWNNSQCLFLTTWGILTENSTKLKSLILSGKLLISFWILGSMFITLSYKTVLLSFLTFPAFTGIRSISQLSKGSESYSIKCSTYNGAAIFSLLNNSDVESWNKIAQCLKRNLMFDKTLEDFMFDTKYKKAYIGTRSHLQTLSRGYFISSESFGSVMLAIAVRKTFCCKKVLDEIIHKTAATGILHKFERDLRFFMTETSVNPKLKESDRNEKLTMEDLFGAFLVLIFGHICAFITFIFEFKKRQKHCRKF